MSKGRQPRPKAPVPPIKPRRKPKGNGGPIGPDGPPSRDRCWTFVVVDATAAARTAQKGTAVQGAVQHQRIAVLATGVLGYAPARESREMISALETTRGALAGEIVFVLKDENPEVILCLS